MSHLDGLGRQPHHAATDAGRGWGPGPGSCERMSSEGLDQGHPYIFGSRIQTRTQGDMVLDAECDVNAAQLRLSDDEFWGRTYPAGRAGQQP